MTPDLNLTAFVGYVDTAGNCIIIDHRGFTITPTNFTVSATWTWPPPRVSVRQESGRAAQEKDADASS